jgi:hypothetical protein
MSAGINDIKERVRLEKLKTISMTEELRIEPEEL